MSAWLIDRRLFLIEMGLIFVFAALGTVFGVVQVVQGNRFLDLAQQNRIRRVWIGSPRGKILDRRGELCVDNRASFDVALEYEALKTRQAAVRFLSHVFKTSPEEIERLIRNDRGPAYLPIPIKKDVDMETLTRVEEGKTGVTGLVVQVNPVRHYGLASVAAAALGHVGPIDRSEYQALKDRGYHWLDVTGKSGVEAACEVYLRGESGGMQVEVDHRGYRERILGIKKPLPGRDVYLTLDLKIQRALEEVLAGKIGCGIVMDPKTGEILAVASHPSFDLNLFARPDLKGELLNLLKDPDRPLMNRAFQGLYGPGSLFKLVVAAAGLDSGIVNGQTAVDCPGFYRVGGTFFRCWSERGHGHVSLEEALRLSCNVFFYRLGERLGPERMAEYARRFGLGEVTGLDVGNERAGFIPTPAWKREKRGEPWYGGDTANFAIGQGYAAVTPLQVASLVSAIANGGKLMTPFLIKRVVLPEGRTLIEMGPRVRRSLNFHPEVLEKIRRGMWSVVNEADGTGHLARLDTVEVCGKTGTVEVRRGTEVAKQGWFAAFAPAQNPQIVLVLLVEGVTSGGRDVAPLAREVLERYFT